MKPGRFSDVLRQIMRETFEDLNARPAEPPPPEQPGDEEETDEEQDEREQAIVRWAASAGQKGTR